MARVIQISDRELTRLRVMIDLADDRLTPNFDSRSLVGPVAEP